MRKQFKLWKFIIAVMAILIFSSLFAFIYDEQVKLPSENWSNSIEIDSYQPNMDFSSLAASNTFALPISDSHFINIYTLDHKVKLKTFDLKGTLVSEGSVDFETDLSDVSGSYNNGILELIVLDQNDANIHFVSINPTTYEEMDHKTVTYENMNFKLSDTYVTAFDETEAILIKKDTAKAYTPEIDGRIELAQFGEFNDTVVLSVISMKNSTFHLNVLTDNGSIVKTDMLYILPSLNAINPVNVAVASQNNEVVVISTMKHARFGTNYVDFFMFDKGTPDQFNHSGYEVDTYEAVPYIIQETDGSLSYLINFWASNLGRTEIAKNIQAYPNLYKTSQTSGEFKQLTKSERSSVKPSYFKLGDYEYLIHNEQNDQNNIVYMSSDNPDFISASKDYSSSTLFDIFMRTITTYPALILAGIPPLMTAILPVLVITAPIMMFKLNWAEQNKEKMTAIILLVYLASKVYAFGFDIFPFFTNENAWPNFLLSPLSHWGAFIVLSAMSFFVYLSRNRSREGKNDHFLKQITFYIILDVLIMITFFMPYSII